MAEMRAVPRNGSLAIFINGKFMGLIYLTRLGGYQGKIKLKKVM